MGKLQSVEEAMRELEKVRLNSLMQGVGFMSIDIHGNVKSIDPDSIRIEDDDPETKTTGER